MNSQALGQKVYNFCHTLRDDGVSYGDYLEQLTYLIFLKMAHEFAQPPFDRIWDCQGISMAYPCQQTWNELETHYIALLRELGNAPGMLGQIYIKSQNRINDPAKLQRLVQMIDETSWTTDADVLGDVYENYLSAMLQTPNRCWAIFHSTFFDYGHGGMFTSRAKQNDNRPVLWFRWLFPRGLQLHCQNPWRYAG